MSDGLGDGFDGETRHGGRSGLGCGGLRLLFPEFVQADVIGIGLLIGTRSIGDQPLVDRVKNFLQRGRQTAVFLDVPQELLGQQELPGREVHERQLFAEVVDEVPYLDGDRFGVLDGLVLGPGAADIEAVEQHLLPVHLLILLLLFLFLFLVGGRRLGGELVVFHQFQERVDQQLLLEVLLQLHHRHVQHVHRLVQARIDPEVLPQADVLPQSELHATASNRLRNRDVSVGPRYTWATSSL